MSHSFPQILSTRTEHSDSKSSSLIPLYTLQQCCGKILAKYATWACYAGGLGRAAAKMNQLTVKLSELLFVQHFIALVDCARADFHQQQHSTNSRHSSGEAAATTELQKHCCAKLLSWGDRVGAMRATLLNTVFSSRPRPCLRHT